MLIAFVVAGYFFASFINIWVWQALTGTSALTIKEGMTDPANGDAVKLMQCITAILAFFLPALITASVMNRKPVKLLGLSYRVNLKQVGLVCAIMLAALFVSTFLGYVTRLIPLPESLKLQFDKMESDYIKQAAAIIGLKSFADYILALFVMAFIPAFCEEVLFRGGLQNYLTRATRKPWVSIIVVSLLFSVAHISFYGFLPRKQKDKTDELVRLSKYPATIILYESPIRVKETLRQIEKHVGNRQVVISREISKIHEQYIRGTCQELVEWVEEHAIKGECCILIEANMSTEAPIDNIWRESLSIAAHVQTYEATGLTHKEAMKKADTDRQIIK